MPRPGHIVYNRTLLAFARHIGFQPRACRPYRAKTKGKVERPFRYVREDFFLGGASATSTISTTSSAWLDRSPMPACTPRPGGSSPRHFADERPRCKPLPAGPSRPCCASSDGITRDGMVSVGGNLYSVPDAPAARSRCTAPPTIRILEDGEHRDRRSSCAGGAAAAPHRSPAHRSRRRLAAPRGIAAATAIARRRSRVPLRSLAFYDSRRRRLGRSGSHEDQRLRRPSSTSAHSLVALRMPRALETLDVTLASIERGQIGAIEAIEMLLAEELTVREKPPHQGGAADGPAATDQDAVGLRLRVPALARPQPHPGARRARLHRPRTRSCI
jgi:hypothetical protein